MGEKNRPERRNTATENKEMADVHEVKEWQARVEGKRSRVGRRR